VIREVLDNVSDMAKLWLFIVSYSTKTEMARSPCSFVLVYIINSFKPKIMSARKQLMLLTVKRGV